MRNDEIMRYFAFFFWLQRKVTTSPKIMLLSDVETEKVREGLFLLRPEDFTISHTIGTLLKSRRITDADLELHKIVANLPSKTHVVT